MKHTAGRAFHNRTRLLLVAFLTAFGVLVSASQVFGSFGTATNFAANSQPVDAAIGDLNGNGTLDLVVANSNANGVSVLLGNGDATFAAPVLYGIGGGSATNSVAIGNLNGDAFPDLAVANAGSSVVVVLPGNGDGTFGTGATFNVGNYPTSVAIGDLNGDDNPDLVTANNGSTNVSILFSDGSGSFDAATTLEIGFTGPRSVILGNLNGDSFLDIAVVTPPVTLVGDVELSQGSVLFGNGDGTFGNAANFTTGRGSVEGAIGDFNADGKPDLAVANVNSNNVSILLGDGLNGFGPATNFPAGQNPQAIATGDLDGDAHLDLVVPNSSNSISVLNGNGDGTFADPVSSAAGTFPSSAVVGNLNGDSNPDLAVANSNSNNVSILLNQAPTATAAPVSLSFGDQDVGSTSAAQTVTVTNTSGGDPMSVSGASVTGTDAADFGFAGETCSAGPVPLAGTCEVEITFTPAATGARSASLEITYNGGASPLTVPLTGTGVSICPEFTAGTPPDCFPIPCSAGFSGNEPDCVELKARISKLTVTGPGKVKKGKKATYKAKITNSGDARATGVKLVASGKGISSKVLVGAINPGATRTVKLPIKPSRKGRIKAIFKVVSNNAGSKSVRKTVRVR